MTGYTDLQQSNCFMVEKVMIISLPTGEMIYCMEMKAKTLLKVNLVMITCLAEQVTTNFTVETVWIKYMAMILQLMNLGTIKFSEEQDKTYYLAGLETISSMEETIAMQ